MKIEDIKNLPEYENQYVERCDLSTIDDVGDVDFVDDDVLVSQILSKNPETGFPMNDLTVLTTTTNTEVRDYLLRCIKSMRPVDNSRISEDDLEKLHYSKFDTPDSYVQRLQSFLTADSNE